MAGGEQLPYFVSILIPDQPNAFAIGGSIADHFDDEILSHLGGAIASIKVPGNSAVDEDRNLQFAGRVYLYYQVDLTLQQVGALQDKFENHHMEIQYRSLEYASQHQWERQRRDNIGLAQFRAQNPDLFSSVLSFR